jgi:hypothetical protein
MDVSASDSGLEIFRPRKVLAAAMGAAGILWIGVLAYLIQFDRVPARTFLSTIFFILFFGLSLAYYVRTAILVDRRGLTYRGIVRTQRFTFDDIRKVDVLPGPVTVYAIRGKGRFIHFTSFFKHHQRLMKLLVERAGLSPNRL